MVQVEADSSSIPVRKSLLYSVLFIGLVGVAVTAGFASSLAIRSGVIKPLAYTLTFSMVLVALYPYLKIRSEMRGTTLSAPLWKWVLVSVASSAVGNFLIGPLVTG